MTSDLFILNFYLSFPYFSKMHEKTYLLSRISSYQTNVLEISRVYNIYTLQKMFISGKTLQNNLQD